MQARVSRKLLDRPEHLPQEVREVAWKAHLRLCHRYRRLVPFGKPKVFVITAIAPRDAALRLGDRPDGAAPTGVG